VCSSDLQVKEGVSFGGLMEIVATVDDVYGTLESFFLDNDLYVAERIDALETALIAEHDATQAAIGAIDVGGGGVNVLPATGIVADRSAGVTLTPVVGETVSQSITLYQSDGTTAVDLSSKTLAIVFETMSGVDVAVVADGDITVSGANSNVVTFAYPSTVTATERVLRFAIRDAAAPLTMYLQGLCSVLRAPQVDP
jgi:hypothetical protein